MAPMGDALYLSVSAKGCPERDMRLAFLRDDEVWDEYRVVHRLKKPGQVSVPVAWRDGPTTLLFTVGEAEISIRQDGKLLGSAPVRREQAERGGEGCRGSVGIRDVWTAASGVAVKEGGTVVRAREGWVLRSCFYNYIF